MSHEDLTSAPAPSDRVARPESANGTGETATPAPHGDRGADEAGRRAARIGRRANAADWPLHPDKSTWQSALQELRVAQEELRQRNEELASAATALDAERRRYHELFNFAPDSYLVTDPHGVIREANQPAASLVGHDPVRMAGRSLRLYIHPDHRYAFDLLSARLRAGESVQGVESLVQPKAGGLAVPVSIHAGVERKDSGRIVGLRWLLHDLRSLEEAQGRAVEAERLAAVGQTVAALAHESRNALQRTQACLRLLALECTGAKALEYIARVQKAQEDLARLFEDVRTFTAPPVLDRKPCQLEAIWRTAWQDLRVTNEGLAAEFVEDVRADDLTCKVDPFRVGQVFRNLFDNALAACRTGILSPNDDPLRVVIRAENSRSAGRPALRVTIEDNGPGLTADQRLRVFDPFFTTKTGGMGLGLAIARRVVEAHGGTIVAADADIGGAAFVLTLPRDKGEEKW